MSPQSIPTLTEGSAADAKEMAAFQKLVKKGFKAFVAPAGSDQRFPDFGLRTKIGDLVVDLHVEYKANVKAQMGGMRDWVFDGSKFDAVTVDSNKQFLLGVMNSNDTAKANAAKLLKAYQKVFGKSVTQLSSSMFTFMKDQAKRRELLIKANAGIDSYAIARLATPEMGKRVIDHYKKKFKPNGDADVSLLLMMIGNQMYLIQQKGVTMTTEQKAALYKKIGVSDLPKFTNVSAQLEVRVQPRGLNSSKPVSMDVMAQLRLTSVPPGAEVK